MDGKKYISAKLALDGVTLALDDLHDLRDILLAGIMVRCFHHHAHDRLSAGLTHQNTTSITQCLGQLAHDHLLRRHDFHHFQAGQDAFTGAGVLGEDDMAALLTADTAAVLRHVLIDVLVANSKRNPLLM